VLPGVLAAQSRDHRRAFRCLFRILYFGTGLAFREDPGLRSCSARRRRFRSGPSSYTRERRGNTSRLRTAFDSEARANLAARRQRAAPLERHVTRTVAVARSRTNRPSEPILNADANPADTPRLIRSSGVVKSEQIVAVAPNRGIVVSGRRGGPMGIVPTMLKTRRPERRQSLRGDRCRPTRS